MHLLISAVAVVVVLAGVYVNRSAVQESGVEEVVEVSAQKVVDVSNVAGAKDSVEVVVTPTTAQSPSVSPTVVPVSDNVESSYQYPGSTVVSSSPGYLELASGDDADLITDWYKTMIKDSGMNVTSFVTTKTNGNVLNKLAGADGSAELNVEISKVAPEESVVIKVSF